VLTRINWDAMAIGIWWVPLFRKSARSSHTCSHRGRADSGLRAQGAALESGIYHDLLQEPDNQVSGVNDREILRMLAEISGKP
jgi:hypothetical protein